MSYFPRYATDKTLEYIFTFEFKIAQFIKIEASWLARISKFVGLTQKDIDDVYLTEISVEEFLEKEKETNHDIAALIKCLVAKLKDNPAAKFIHIGLTSNDINDTILGLQMLVINDTIYKKLNVLYNILKTKTWDHKNVLCCGRTHGQVATIMTYGQRFASWFFELQPIMHKFDKTYAYGKLAGAVGNYSAIKYVVQCTDRYCEEIELDVLNDIHPRLFPALSKTQVVTRTYLSDLIYNLIVAASVCGKICHQIRHLSRTEINEINEEFKSTSIGSSAMPHKQNPVRSERVCGIVKTLQPMMITALMNIDLADERDISNSSSERIMIENVARLTDFVVSETSDILTNMYINYYQISANVTNHRREMLSELRMTRMTMTGLDRQSAYDLVKNNSGDKEDDFSNDLFTYLEYGFDPSSIEPNVPPSQQQ